MAARSRKSDQRGERRLQPDVPVRRDTQRDRFAPLGLGSSRSWLFGSLAALTAATLILNGDGLTFEGDNILIALIWVIMAAALSFARWYRGKPFRFSESARKTSRDESVDATSCPVGGCRWFDVIAVIFFGWVLLSFAVSWCSGNGSPRAMLTMLAHWCGFAAMFVSWRLLLNGRQMVRGMLLLFVAGIIAESSAAYYHYYYTGPQERQVYFEEREKELQADTPQSPGERELLENRIKSVEPLGTYSLTNSLAGVLAPWCVFLCGVLLSARRLRPTSQSENRLAGRYFGIQSLILLTLIALVGFILLMTNSRSGVLATLFGVVCLFGYLGASHLSNKRTLLVAALVTGVVIAGGLGIGYAAGQLDKMFTGPLKSLGYRVQYWQSSSHMIADHPFFGSGIGNFREYYTQYKLPTASESIADPHNLFFEIASNAGLPALACFVTLLVAAIVCALASKLQDAQNEPCDIAPRPEHLKASRPNSAAMYFETSRACWQFRLPILIGGVVGIVVAFVYSYTNYAPMPFDITCFALAGFLLGFLLFAPIIDLTDIPLKALAPICLAVLTVDLLAAGGISFPHVNVTFWFLLALCFNISNDGNVPHAGKATNRRGDVLFLGLAACFLAMVVTLYPAAWLANLRANTLLRNMQASPSQFAFLDRQIAQFEKIVENDPYRTQIWCDLCAAYLVEQREFPELARKQPDTSGWRTVVEKQMRKAGVSRDLGRVTLSGATGKALAHAILSSPSSATMYQNLGSVFYDDYERSKNRDSLELAVALFELAAARYPNNSLAFAFLAMCYGETGEKELQHVKASRAIELDDITPHSDRKLPPDLRRMVEQLAHP